MYQYIAEGGALWHRLLLMEDILSLNTCKKSKITCNKGNALHKQIQNDWGNMKPNIQEGIFQGACITP